MRPVAPHEITTAQQLWDAGDIGRCELVRGELVMMSLAEGEHGRVTMELARLIASHVRHHDLGVVYATDTGFIIETGPDTVRAPDFAYIQRSRVPARSLRGFVTVVPDLVVETVSPDDSAGDVFDKVQQWLAAGCRLVWVVDPQSRTAMAYEPGGRATLVRADEALGGGEVLPGFELRLGEIFQ